MKRKIPPKTLFEVFTGRLPSSIASPCPFCGMKEPCLAKGQPYTERYWVECNDLACSARGPIRRTSEESAVAWNELNGIKPHERG